MLFKLIIIAALLHEFSCDHDLELHYEVIIVPETVEAGFSCDGVLISPKFFVAYFPCVEKLFETYDNVPLKVLAGLKLLADNNGEMKGYEQHTYAVSYVASKYSKTAIVEVEEPFDKSKKVNFANLPKEGEKICKQPIAVTLFLEEASEHTGRGWLKRKIQQLKAKIKEVKEKIKKKVKKIVKKVTDVVKKVHKITGGKKKNKRIHSRKYEPSETQNKDTDTNRYFAITDEISPHMCKKHTGWPTFCGRTIWGFQTMCEQSKTRAGGFDLELSDINDDLDLIAKQTGIKTKDGKEKAKGSAFTPRAANEIFLLTIGLLKLF